MILLGSFFTITEQQATSNSLLATISIDPSHSIFEGHFPGQPVLPGVCMLQMMKELLETITGKILQLKKGDHLKFLSIINPLENPWVKVELSYIEGTDETALTARLFKDAVTFFKFKGVFIPKMD